MDIDAFVRATNRRLDELERRAAAPRQETSIAAKIDAADLQQLGQQINDGIREIHDHVEQAMQQSSAQAAAIEERVAAIEDRVAAIEDRLTTPPSDGADGADAADGKQAADATQGQD